MRILLIVVVIATLFYAMTGLVYFEGSFDGALVVKPYPMFQVIFGGGEEGAWARHNPGVDPPWFMQGDLLVIRGFTWEYGVPLWITAYEWGFLVTLAAWAVLAVAGVVRVLRMVVGKASV